MCHSILHPRKLSLTFVLFILLSLSSCFREANYLIPQLANSGPQPLSSRSAYVAPNLLLATEMANSKVVDTLTKQVGIPDAIEVEKSASEPYKLSLYYLRDKQGYVLERYRSEWIVAGPEKIPADRMKKVQVATRGKFNQAPVLIDGGLNTLGPDEKPTPSANTVAEEAPIFVDLNEREAQNPVPLRRAPKEDVHHRVSQPRETLSGIAKWYTEDESNTAAIGRINNIDPSVPLQIGQEVRIPTYMLKQTAPMPTAME